MVSVRINLTFELKFKFSEKAYATEPEMNQKQYENAYGLKRNKIV